MNVQWTVKHRHWVGDDWAGKWETTAPDEVEEGVVAGYVYDGNQTLAVIHNNSSLFTLPLDELTVVRRTPR